MDYNSVDDNTGLSSIIDLAIVGSQIFEILSEFKLIAGQGHRSWCHSKVPM